jgi:uncharacterized protein YegL
MSGLENVEFLHPQEPHVATVLLLDTSGSMAGLNINLLNEGLKSFRDDLADPNGLARKRAEIAVVTFGTGVNVIHDFSSIEEFEPPTLFAGGLTPMGEAILKAIDLVENRKTDYKNEGIDFYRPWIFMITDGGPTDMKSGDSMWDEVIKKVHSGEANRKFSFYAVGVEDANMELLKLIAPPNREPVKLKERHFKEMFEWLSKSHELISQSSPGEQVALPNPAGPKGWCEV